MLGTDPFPTKMRQCAQSLFRFLFLLNRGSRKADSTQAKPAFELVGNQSPQMASAVTAHPVIETFSDKLPSPLNRPIIKAFRELVEFSKSHRLFGMFYLVRIEYVFDKS